MAYLCDWMHIHTGLKIILPYLNNCEGCSFKIPSTAVFAKWWNPITFKALLRNTRVIRVCCLLIVYFLYCSPSHTHSMIDLRLAYSVSFTRLPKWTLKEKIHCLPKWTGLFFPPPRISTLWLSRVTTADLGDLLFLTFKFELLTQMRHCASKIFCLAWRWVFKWLLEPSGTQLIKHPRQHSAPVSLAGFRSLGLSRKWLTVDPDREKTA